MWKLWSHTCSFINLALGLNSHCLNWMGVPTGLINTKHLTIDNAMTFHFSNASFGIGLVLNESTVARLPDFRESIISWHNYRPLNIICRSVNSASWLCTQRFLLACNTMRQGLQLRKAKPSIDSRSSYINISHSHKQNWTLALGGRLLPGLTGLHAWSSFLTATREGLTQ